MKIKCKKCGYEWDTKSKLIYITCPNCYNKVKSDSANEKILDTTNAKPISKEHIPMDSPLESEELEEANSRNWSEVI